MINLNYFTIKAGEARKSQWKVPVLFLVAAPFYGSARIKPQGLGSGYVQRHFRISPEPITELTPSPSESRASEMQDSSRCLGRAFASQVMATHPS